MSKILASAPTCKIHYSTEKNRLELEIHLPWNPVTAQNLFVHETNQQQKKMCEKISLSIDDR